MKEKKAAEEKKAEEADPKAYLAAKKAAEKAKKAAKDGEKPSLFYLIVALITILAVAVCVIYTTVHYLDFEQKVKVYDKVSFVPLMDKAQ